MTTSSRIFYYFLHCRLSVLIKWRGMIRVFYWSVVSTLLIYLDSPIPAPWHLEFTCLVDSKSFVTNNCLVTNNSLARYQHFSISSLFPQRFQVYC